MPPPHQSSHHQVYLGLLRRFSDVPIANLSKPGTWKKEKSPFKYFSWFDGSIVLQFLDRSIPLQPSEWQDFQAHRRIWAVIGVLHVPSCDPGALASVEAEFQVSRVEWRSKSLHVEPHTGRTP